eukprot:scaffold491927_cov18-Prasinocladus_malaysianus.AAC.1
MTQTAFSVNTYVGEVLVGQLGYGDVVLTHRCDPPVPWFSAASTQRYISRNNRSQFASEQREGYNAPVPSCCVPSQRI